MATSTPPLNHLSMKIYLPVLMRRIEAGGENTNCLKASPECHKYFNYSMFRIMTSRTHTVSFLQLVKSSSKIEVCLFGRWYKDEMLLCLCDSAL